MTFVTLEEVKAHLGTDHDADDPLIEQLIAASEQEARMFLGREQLPTLPLDYPPEYDSEENEISEDVPSSEDPIADDVRVAIYLLVQAKYDAVGAEEMARLRAVAEGLLMPYRVGLGA